MDKDRKDILTDGFRKRLQNHKMEVNDEVWRKIDKDLAPVKKPRYSLSYYVTTAVAAVAAIALILISLNKYYTTVHTDSDNNLIVESDSNINTPVPVISGSTDEILSEDPGSVQITTMPRNSFDKIVEKQDVHIDDSPEVFPEELIAEDTSSENINIHAKEQEENKKKDNYSGKGVLPTYTEDVGIFKTSRKKKNDLSLALAYGSQNSSSLSYSPESAVLRYSETFPEVNTLNADGLGDNSVISDTHYKMPLSVAFSVRKNIAENWAVETGLTYTYLESRETYTHTNGSSSHKDIQLNYLGIPVKLVYSFLNYDRFSLYASAGGMMEKSVYGKEIKSDNTSNKLDVSELQWSLMGNVGANYRLVDHLSVFVEPGIAYYFDDGSDVQTVRKDKPWNFNLQLGLRLTY